MALPADYQTCNVTGSWVDIATGEPGSGFVVFTPRATRITTGSEVIVLPSPRRVWLEDGGIDVDFPATDDPDVQPVDWTYVVTETIGGVQYAAYDIEAPAGGSVDLSEVAGVGSAGTIVALPHAASHAAAGSDPITITTTQVTGLDGTLFNLGSEITDHRFEDHTTAHGGLASAAQGALADSAVQPGDLAAVATSGDYDDLSNKPSIPPAAPVDSVNGETGVVVLDAEDVEAIPATAVGLAAGERNRGDWSALTNYLAGAVVHDHGGDGQVYRANAANVGEQPSLGLGSWDLIDLTERSVALGLAAEAGAAAAAVGNIAAASGLGSTAVGFDASASGVGSTAIGTEASASGVGSTAIGTGVSATEAGEVNVGNIFHGRYDYDGAGPVAASIATGFLDLPETVSTTDPAAGHQRLVARTDGLYVRDETGTEVGPLGAGGGGGIPETLIDAAGDLIVGTAADTAGRLALGAAGTVLTSNGTAPTWALPPMQSIGYVSGAVYGLGGNSASVNTHLATTAGRWVAHPVWLPAGNYSGLSVLSTVAAASTWRLGIYNGTPDGATTLLHDCGTVNTNATPGSLLASSAFTIPTTGLYWLAILVDAYTAAPTVWSFRGVVSDIPALPFLGHRFPNATTTRVYFARFASGVATGAMPATAPTQSLTDQPCLIRAHAA